ncbi:hypothetical protein ACRTEV_05330 [Rossellomorea arthrocnemi]
MNLFLWLSVGFFIIGFAVLAFIKKSWKVRITQLSNRSFGWSRERQLGE